MRKKLKTTLLLLAMIISTTAFAQSAEKLYTAGKKLYDAEQYEQAFPKLKAAADKGHKKAQYRVGLCYDKGRGVTEDDAKAVAWYQKAVDQGYAKAQYQLGKCYKNGEGIAKDEKKAVELFLLAAKQDNGDAQYQLAKCYLKGKGVAKDEAKAKAWLKKAVKNEKDGKAIRKDIEKDAANGKDDAKQLKEMMKK